MQFLEIKKNLPCFTKYNINRDASCIASLYNSETKIISTWSNKENSKELSYITNIPCKYELQSTKYVGIDLKLYL